MILPLACKVQLLSSSAHNVTMTSVCKINTGQSKQPVIQAHDLQNCSCMEIELQVIAFGDLGSSISELQLQSSADLCHLRTWLKQLSQTVD